MYDLFTFDWRLAAEQMWRTFKGDVLQIMLFVFVLLNNLVHSWLFLFFVIRLSFSLFCVALLLHCEDVRQDRIRASKGSFLFFIKFFLCNRYKHRLAITRKIAWVFKREVWVFSLLAWVFGRICFLLLFFHLLACKTSSMSQLEQPSLSRIHQNLVFKHFEVLLSVAYIDFLKFSWLLLIIGLLISKFRLRLGTNFVCF